MRRRCNDKSYHKYGSYGGRGITICKRWDSYPNFLADMGKRPSVRYSLDRVDNDGDYSPANCKWSTSTQQNNNKRSNTLLTYNDDTLTMRQWSNKLGLDYDTLRMRLSRGWSVKRALGYK